MKTLLRLLLLLFVSAAGAYAQDLSNPVCGLNNNSTNIPPSAANVVTVDGTTSFSWHDFATTTNYPDVGHTFVDNSYGGTPCTHKVLTNSNTLGNGLSHGYAISPSMDKGDCYEITQIPNIGLSSQFVISSPTGSCVGGFGTWGQTVLTSGQMPARTSHNEFVWDYFTQGKFWFANGNVIGFCTITGIGTTSCTNNFHTFSEYAGGACNMIDYSAMSSTGAIVLVCQATPGGTMDAFTYNTQTNTKNPAYTTACTATVSGANQPGCIHKIAGPTKDDGILIQFVGNTCGTESGNHLWAPPWTLPTPQIECKTDHVDVMGDLSGNSVAMYEDFQDNANYCLGFGPGFSPALTRLPLVGNPLGQICVIKEFGWDISTRDYPIRPWGLYSVQGTGPQIGVSENCNNGAYADPTTGNWNVFENELILTRVDAGNDFTKIWRLGLTHQRGKCSGDFYTDPRAAISMDGKYITYATNARWGAAGKGSLAEPVDIVVIGGGVSGGVLQPLFAASNSPNIQLSSGSLNFGSQAVNTTSSALTVTVTNNGTATLTLNNPYFTVTGANASDFSNPGTGTCANSGTLAVNASCTINLTFRPPAVGNRSATLSVLGNAPNSPQTVVLSGTGIAPTADINNSTLSFGNVNIGNTSSALSFTITNNGTAVLIFNSFVLGGTNSADFAISANTCPANLNVSLNCTVSVTFTPSAVGNRVATITITDNALNSPQVVNLNGTGVSGVPIPSFSPPAVSFFNQFINTTSAIPQVVVLTNSGSAVLVISSFTFSGANPGEFSQTNNCPANLNVSASCNINIFFSPVVLGPRSANLLVTDNGNGSPQTIPLDGTGIKTIGGAGTITGNGTIKVQP